MELLGGQGQELMGYWRILIALLLALAAPLALGADDPLSISAITLSTNAEGQQEYSVSLQILLIMTALSFIPAFVMLMTSFTRIIIVFSILRQALGLQQTPSNQILTGMALFLTMFIMGPVFDQVNRDALQPYLNEQLPAQEAIKRAEVPVKNFMLAQTRSSDLELFVRLSKHRHPVARRRAADHPDPGLHHVRAEDRIPDRFHDLHPVPDHRPGGGQRADGHGHDDAVTADHLAAVQDHAVRARGWLGADHRHARRKLWRGLAMTPEVAVDLFREALWLTCVIVGILVVPSLVVGLIVAMFQAATQINEQTLSFLPRLLVMLISLMWAGPWLTRELMEYMTNLYHNIPMLIG